MLMNIIFTDLIVGEKVAVYMNNILIYSANEKAHRETTHEVLRCFEQYNLYLKPKKCKFNCNHIKYLSIIIKPSQISMDQGKVTAIANWPTPRNLRNIQRFLDFANFYRRFIKNFSAKARLLNDLIKKDMPWCWEENEAAAFAMLKQAFAEATILALYDPNRSTEVEVDTSNFAIGGVLLWKGNDGL